MYNYTYPYIYLRSRDHLVVFPPSLQNRSGRSYLAVILALTIGSLFVFISLITFQSQKAENLVFDNKNLESFTPDELVYYNGTNPERPIYLGLDGLVYDVTIGQEYYKLGGKYHALAGRDASLELHLVGAGIVRRKYPVIGYLKS